MSDLHERIDAIFNDFADETQAWGRRNPASWRDEVLATIRDALTDDAVRRAVTNALGRMFRTDGIDSNGYERYKPGDYADEAIRTILATIGIGGPTMRTDERIERVMRAMVECMRQSGTVLYETNRMPTPDDLAGAAVAALDAEPLEDVLTDAGIYDVYVLAVTLEDGSDAWECIVKEPVRERRSGTGATIDAAIRAAIANAKEVER